MKDFAWMTLNDMLIIRFTIKNNKKLGNQS